MEGDCWATAVMAAPAQEPPETPQAVLSPRAVNTANLPCIQSVGSFKVTGDLIKFLQSLLT